MPSFTRKVKFPLTNHVDVTGIVHSNLFESEYSRVGLSSGNDSYTKALLRCNGTDGSQTFTDDVGHIFTAAGNAQIDTGTTDAFGGNAGVGQFDGTGDWITTPYSADFDFGTGDFTIEGFINSNNYSHGNGANRFINGGAITSGANKHWFIGAGTAWGGGVKINFGYYDGAAYVERTTPAVTANTGTWYHLEITRQGANVYFFWGGVLKDTWAMGAGVAINSGSVASSTGLIIGARYSANSSDITEPSNAFFDCMRISKGIARHTSGFTPPTVEHVYANYLTSSPSPATAWTALQAGDVVDMSTAKAWMYKDGVVQAAGNTDVTFKYAANGGSDSTAKTLTQLRAESDVTVTDETNSFKIYGLYASDGAYKSESETWIEFNVVSAAGGNVYCLID